MPITPHPPSYPKAVKSSTARRQYLRQQRTQRERFTPAQIRQIEREEAQKKQARESEERERKRKLARKRKEEKEAKEREERRKLVQEGKLTEEDTWGKCAASQQRLNTFFRAFGQADTGRNRKRKRDEREVVGYRRDNSVASAPAINSSTHDSEQPDLQHLSSSAPDNMVSKDIQEEGSSPTPNPPSENNEMEATSPTKQSIPTEQSPHRQSDDLSSQSTEDFEIFVDLDIAAALSNKQTDSEQRRLTCSDDVDSKLQEDQLSKLLLKSAADADTDSHTQATPNGRHSTETSKMNTELSDEITSRQTHFPDNTVSAAQEIYSTPTKRVALGKMSPSHLNIRASQRTDNTAVPSDSSLPSPSPSPARVNQQTTVRSPPDVDVNAQSAAQVLAMICSQDIKGVGDEEIEDVEEDEDKENKDPQKALLNLMTGKNGSEPTIKVNSSSPATTRVESQPLMEKLLGSSDYAPQNDSESETEYEDLFDNYDNNDDDNDDDPTGATIPDLQPENVNEANSAISNSLKCTDTPNALEATDQLAITGSMKNTFVDVHGSPHKPKPTPPGSLPTKTALTPTFTKPIPFALSPHSPLVSAKKSPKTQTQNQTPPKKKNRKLAESSPLKPKNEFSSFGLEGIDEEDLAMMADAFEQAERRNSGGSKGKREMKGKGKVLEA
ncbi:MAG: hypothetical protein Q9160_009186 [Pyrenula sp. 1 TL-2023]